MKTKERLFLVIMILLFALSAGMFYYQNVYKVEEAEKNKVLVLMAKKNINIGAELNDKNVGWIKISKDSVSPNYITKDKETEVQGKKVTEKILEGELINKNRLSKEVQSGNRINKYTIDIAPNFSSEIAEGDLIRVFVQIVDKDDNNKIYNRLVFDKKEVLEVISKEEGIAGSNQFNSLKVEVSDKEAIYYYNAKQRGSIVVLKYKEDALTSDYQIPIIDINEQE